MQSAHPLLTTAEVADMLRVTRQTVNRWATDGLLCPIDFPGKHLRFRREDVERLLRPASDRASA